MKESEQDDHLAPERLPTPRKKRWIRKRDSRLRFIHCENQDVVATQSRLNVAPQGRGETLSDYVRRRRRAARSESSRDECPNCASSDIQAVTPCVGLADVKERIQESAMSAAATKRKPGRKGRNVVNAFINVPYVPTSAIAFASQHGVSVAVLRQAKRFDKVGHGKVTVKKDKDSNTLMIWRCI
jgi:hypothetical protein